MYGVRPGWLWLALATAGCVGTVGNSAGPGPGSQPPKGGGDPTIPGTGNGAGGSGVPVGSGCQEGAPIVTAVRRLTGEEYASTLRDLLGEAQRMAVVAFPKDDTGDGVPDPRSLIVTPAWAANAMEAAESAAKLAVANLPALLPCNPAGAEQACARQFAQSLTRRAFRRPPAPAELDALMKVYAVGAQGGGFPHGIEVLV